jgi:hypothetical protein
LLVPLNLGYLPTITSSQFQFADVSLKLYISVCLSQPSLFTNTQVFIHTVRESLSSGTRIICSESTSDLLQTEEKGKLTAGCVPSERNVYEQLTSRGCCTYGLEAEKRASPSGNSKRCPTQNRRAMKHQAQEGSCHLTDKGQDSLSSRAQRNVRSTVKLENAKPITRCFDVGPPE